MTHSNSFNESDCKLGETFLRRQLPFALNIYFIYKNELSENNFIYYFKCPMIAGTVSLIIDIILLILLFYG